LAIYTEGRVCSNFLDGQYWIGVNVLIHPPTVHNGRNKGADVSLCQERHER
jgi:hypothetical protein